MRATRLTIVLMLAFVAVSNAELYVVAHFPYGGGWGTRLLLTNGSPNPVTVELDYFTPRGQPASVPLAGPELVGTKQLLIGPNQVATIATDPAKRNASDLLVTWAVAKSNGPLNIFTLFDYAPTSVPSTVPNSQIVSAVGAAAAPAGQSFRFPVFVNGATRFNAGMALANPNNVAAAISLTLLDKDGHTRASRVLSLSPNEQTSFLLTDNIAFEGSLGASDLFTGSVAVCATAPIGLVALGVEGSVLFTVSVSTDYRCN
jgi:hypothetical protein